MKDFWIDCGKTSEVPHLNTLELHVATQGEGFQPRNRATVTCIDAGAVGEGIHLEMGQWCLPKLKTKRLVETCRRLPMIAQTEDTQLTFTKTVTKMPFGSTFCTEKSPSICPKLYLDQKFHKFMGPNIPLKQVQVLQRLQTVLPFRRSAGRSKTPHQQWRDFMEADLHLHLDIPWHTLIGSAHIYQHDQLLMVPNAQYAVVLTFFL